MHPAVLSVFAACVLAATSATPDAAFQSGDLDAAYTGYTQALRVQPRNVGALIGSATLELYRNDLCAARQHIQQALAIDPTSSAAAHLQRTLQRRVAAADDFRVVQGSSAVLPFIATRPLPIVRMRINGIDARVAIDTGAPNVVVTAAFAQAHHLHVVDAGEGVFAGGRRAAIRSTSIQKLAADALVMRDVRADVSPGPPSSDAPFDAVIGSQFFSHFTVTIDYPGQRLVVRPIGAPPPANIVSSIPMWLVGDHFIFARASVNGGSPALFSIDSGAPFGVSLSKEAMDRAQIAVHGDAATFTGGGGQTPVLPFVARSVTLGDARETDVTGAYFPEGDPYRIFPFTVAGALSGGFLERYAVTFDFQSMRIALSSS